MNPNVNIDEDLSAFLDGEFPPRQVELLLRRIERHPHLRERLIRYSTIGECLRNEPDKLFRSFTQRVCDAIAHEAAAQRLAQAPDPAAAAVAARKGGWLRQGMQLAGGLAIAASVAVVAILVFQPDQPASEVADASTAAGDELIAEAGSVGNGPDTVVIGGLREDPADEPIGYTVASPETSSPIAGAARLTDYVFAHSEYSSMLGRRNVLSAVMTGEPMPVEPAEREATAASERGRR